MMTTYSLNYPLSECGITKQADDLSLLMESRSIYVYVVAEPHMWRQYSETGCICIL